MAVLKYTNSNGEIITVNQYKVNNVIVSQEKGASTTDVMSQKAVTDELNMLDHKIENIDVPEIDLSEYYTKAETDEKIVEKPKIYKMYFPCYENYQLDESALQSAIEQNIHTDTTYTEMKQLVEEGYIIVPYFWGEAWMMHFIKGNPNYVIGIKDFYMYDAGKYVGDVPYMQYSIYDLNYNRVYSPNSGYAYFGDWIKTADDRIVISTNYDNNSDYDLIKRNNLDYTSTNNVNTILNEKFCVCTESEYNNMTKDNNTFYFVKE